MGEVYDTGDIARIEATFQLDGAMVDPTTLVLEVTVPDGSTTTYTYGSGSEIQRLDTGRYRSDLACSTAGSWRYRWVASGNVAAVVHGEFLVRDDPVLGMVRSVRDKLHDRPQRTVLAQALSASGTTATVASGDVGRLLGRPGATIEFDDRYGEIALVTGVDEESSTIELRRGQYGTTPTAHAAGTGVLIEPRFSWREITAVLGEAVDTQLWPHVWRSGEFTLTVQPGTEYYSPPVPDIEEVVYAYQITSGRLHGVPVVFLPRGQADEANFPYGAVLVPWVVDSSPVYVAYRARPQIRSLSSDLERLAVLYAASQLTMHEEASLLAPGSSVVDRQLEPGSRMRHGIVLNQLFERARSEIRASLLVSEDEARRRANPRRWML